MLSALCVRLLCCQSWQIRRPPAWEVRGALIFDRPMHTKGNNYTARRHATPPDNTMHPGGSPTTDGTELLFAPPGWKEMRKIEFAATAAAHFIYRVRKFGHCRKRPLKRAIRRGERKFGRVQIFCPAVKI
jgi:hypothetical protein